VSATERSSFTTRPDEAGRRWRRIFLVLGGAVLVYALLAPLTSTDAAQSLGMPLLADRLWPPDEERPRPLLPLKRSHVALLPAAQPIALHPRHSVYERTCFNGALCRGAGAESTAPRRREPRADQERAGGSHRAAPRPDQSRDRLEAWRVHPDGQQARAARA